jgi:hypothetical protein
MWLPNVGIEDTMRNNDRIRRARNSGQGLISWDRKFLRADVASAQQLKVAICG